MLLAQVAAASAAVTSTPGRGAKVQLLAGCLAEASPAELPVVVAWLSGATRQRRTGLGWASLREPVPPAATASLRVLAVDTALERAAAATGAGSQAARRAVLVSLMAAATAPEQHLLGGLISGELRQGAQAGSWCGGGRPPAPGCRRPRCAAPSRCSGDLAAVAVAARAGGAGALAGFRLGVGRALAPMLAGTAPDLDAALQRTGPAGGGVEAGRRPCPGAPRRRRRRGVHPHAWTTSPPGCRRW